MVLGTKGCQRMGSTQTESSVVAPWMQLTGHLVMLPEHEPSWRTGNFDGISWDLVCVRAAVVASRCHVVSLVRLSVLDRYGQMKNRAKYLRLRPGPGQYEAHPAWRQKRDSVCVFLVLIFASLKQNCMSSRKFYGMATWPKLSF